MLRALIVAAALASASGAELTMTALLEEAKFLETRSPDVAEKKYKEIILMKKDLDDPTLASKEAAINALGRFYVDNGKASELTQLTTDVEPLFTKIPQPRAARVFGGLVDLLVNIKGADTLQVAMCEELIKWCRMEGRDFLRQQVETRLVLVYLAQRRYDSAQSLLSNLLSDVKNLDDKLLLVQFHLIECKFFFALGNTQRSKASLIAATTNAKAIQSPPRVRDQIDFWTRTVAAKVTDWADTMRELVRQNDVWAVGAMLAVRPDLAHIRSKDGRGPLFWAYKYGQKEIVQMLLDAGANPDVRDENGQMPEDVEAGENRRLIVV